MFKNRVYKYNDEVYENGDEIWFYRDKNVGWDGPAVVTGTDGSRGVIFSCRGEVNMKRPTNSVQLRYPKDDTINDEVTEEILSDVEIKSDPPSDDENDITKKDTVPIVISTNIKVTKNIDQRGADAIEILQNEGMKSRIEDNTKKNDDQTFLKK